MQSQDGFRSRRSKISTYEGFGISTTTNNWLDIWIQLCWQSSQAVVLGLEPQLDRLNSFIMLYSRWQIEAIPSGQLTRFHFASQMTDGFLSL